MLPNILRKLFANAGVGPLLLDTIIPKATAAEMQAGTSTTKFVTPSGFASCTATTARAGIVPKSVTGMMLGTNTSGTVVWRQRPLIDVGQLFKWSSTTLPANHCWANGDLVSFSAWPELKAVYDAGGFAGMLLAYNATAATIAANLGKWRPNAATPTGLYTPSLGDQFFRNWVSGLSKAAGSWYRDEIRNITGEVPGNASTLRAINSTSFGTGALLLSFVGLLDEQGFQNPAGGGYGRVQKLSFNASSVVNTGSQNVPQHIYQPVIIYLGMAA
jgi:hypothetical protein